MLRCGMKRLSSVLMDPTARRVASPCAGEEGALLQGCPVMLPTEKDRNNFRILECSQWDSTGSLKSPRLGTTCGSKEIGLRERFPKK